MICEFKIWLEEKEYKDVKNLIKNQIARVLKISDKDFNTKQIKELGEDQIEKLNNALISNSIFDKVSNKDEILNCLTFKTDEKGKPILDKNNKKVLINGNCTLSYLARGISLS
jgi:hypothetical protein